MSHLVILVTDSPPLRPEIATTIVAALVPFGEQRYPDCAKLERRGTEPTVFPVAFANAWNQQGC